MSSGKVMILTASIILKAFFKYEDNIIKHFLWNGSFNASLNFFLEKRQLRSIFAGEKKNKIEAVAAKLNVKPTALIFKGSLQRQIINAKPKRFKAKDGRFIKKPPINIIQDSHALKTEGEFPIKIK